METLALISTPELQGTLPTLQSLVWNFENPLCAALPAQVRDFGDPLANFFNAGGQKFWNRSLCPLPDSDSGTSGPR